MTNAQAPATPQPEKKLNSPSTEFSKPVEAPRPSERVPENPPEQPEPSQRSEQKPDALSRSSRPPLTPAPAPPDQQPEPAAKSEMRREIESILTQDLDELYVNLDEKQRQDFRSKGEETASQLERLIETAKITAKKVIHLLKEWLKLLPHLNAFFYEQVVKIKTDRIMALNEKLRKETIDQQ